MKKDIKEFKISQQINGRQGRPISNGVKKEVYFIGIGGMLPDWMQRNSSNIE